ncbi:MAG: 50S ribosomal protein L6 [uncultured bacterium]|nr:MAG: 50S ribosomal protein L6 [uncultured bacterium]
MSRVGKKPVEIKNAKVRLENAAMYFEGPKGKLQLNIPEEVKIEIKDNLIHVSQNKGTEKRVKAFHGLYRALIQNCITGVTVGYEKRLEINGVGFRAKVEGKNLVLALGFSHPIIFPIPEGITFKIEQKDTLLIINGIDKQLLGQVAASIRAYYPPEPYKGKGVKYVDEYIKRKKGKRVA